MRKPTAFNYFVKEKIGQYKTDGITIPDDRNNNELFKVRVLSYEHEVEQDPSLQAYTLLSACGRVSGRGELSTPSPLLWLFKDRLTRQRFALPCTPEGFQGSCIATPPGAPALTLLDLDCRSGRCRSGRR